MSTEFVPPSLASLTGNPLLGRSGAAGAGLVHAPSAGGALAAPPLTAGARTFAALVDQARIRQDAPVVRGVGPPSGAASAPASGGVGQPAASIRVAAGDTLTRLVRDHMDRLGRPVASGTQLTALIRQVAEASGISDPDRIQVGTRLNLSPLERAARPGPTLNAAAAASTTSTAAATPASSTQAGPGVLPPRSLMAAAYVASREASAAPARAPGVAHQVLDQTLQRAVERGFLPEAERSNARERVLQMARTFGFDPDDFARVALMESDGFNPRATNGRCHGIIQFCEGPARGAASVGLEGRAATILDKGVLEQLDLVAQYFRDVGLQRMGPRVSLADLYLTVLTPAARAVRDAGQPLSIAGTQAPALHEAGDRSRPITRTSLTDGLLRNADLRLGDSPAAGKAAIPQRQALAGGAAYRHAALLQAPVPRRDSDSL